MLLIEEMLVKNPQDIFLNYALAMEFKSAKDVDKALSQLDKVIALDKAYIAAYFQKGELLMQIGQSKSALVFLQKGKELALQSNDTRTAGEFSELILALAD